MPSNYVIFMPLSFWYVVYQFKYVALVGKSFKKTLIFCNCFQLTAFPTGGFSHSFGFESATKHGFVTDFSKYLTQLLRLVFTSDSVGVRVVVRVVRALMM